MKCKILISILLMFVTMFILIPNVYGMQIYVQELSGKNITVEVELSDTIEELKQKIQEKSGILSINQNLLFLGKYLEDDKTLAYYNIQNENTIHLIIRIINSIVNIRTKNAIVKIDDKLVTEFNTSSDSSVTFTVEIDDGFMLNDIFATSGIIIDNFDGTYTLKNVVEEKTILYIETIPVGIKSIEKTDTIDDKDIYTITFTDDSKYLFDIKNGKDGLDGKDGITPDFKITENGELNISYDNGSTWESLGKVVGKDGKDAVNEENKIDVSNKYNLRDYLVISVLGLLSLLGNIGWIITLKKKY